MYPTEERIKELRERFGVHNGQYWGYYRFKNLNWYLGDGIMTPGEKDEWFCYGDIRDEDIPRLAALLNPGEILTLGWKELGPDQKEDKFFGTGHDVWLVITCDGAQYDLRVNGKVNL
jgi:hypothetical protein